MPSSSDETADTASPILIFLAAAMFISSRSLLLFLLHRILGFLRIGKMDVPDFRLELYVG